MIKTYDKEKVINILTESKMNITNAFNIIPNLSDKVIDLIESKYNIIDMISSYIPEKRKYKSSILTEIIIMATIQARMKQMFSISEVPMALTSQVLIDKFKLNIEYNKDDNILKESTIRAFLERYDDNETINYNNEFISIFNSFNKDILKKVGINSNIHILDGSVLDVNYSNENYEGSSITFKGGKYLRGYKIGLLRGITDNGGVVEDIIMGTASINDAKLVKDWIVKSEYLKPGDYLLEDRGFLDIDVFKKLNNKGINIIIPSKKNMDIYTAAVEEAKSKNNWVKHPNRKRKGQDITLVKDLELCWLDDRDKNKKPKNIKLNYKINAAVIRFEIDKNKAVLSDDEIIKNEGKYAYAVILTNNISKSCEEIIRLYEMRPEIEEDFRQLKDFWGLNTYKSTKYNIISFITMISLLSYNFYQIFKETEEGKEYIGKNYVVEHKKGLYIIKGVRTVISIDNYFAVFYMDEVLDLYLKLDETKREQLKRLLVL